LLFSPQKSPNSSHSRPTLGADESDSEEEEEKEPVTKKVEEIPNQTPNLPPVLNLHGPPTIRNDADVSPKKRRRKKKKKKHHSGGEAGVA